MGVKVCASHNPKAQPVADTRGGLLYGLLVGSKITVRLSYGIAKVNGASSVIVGCPSSGNRIF